MSPAKKRYLLAMAFPPVLLQSCATTDKAYEQTYDPFYAQDTEQQLKTEEDWARWQNQQKQNNTAILIIPTTK